MSDTRLQVLLSRAGVASRRAAERMIRQGRVTVNGEVVTEMGSRANPHRDRIELDGEPVGDAQAPATIVMHKPVRVVTTRDDPEGRETVTHIVDGEPFRFLPVGRLDYHTEGLLLLTTDGELTNRLLHPKYHVPKVYMVKVRGAVKRSAIDQLRQGVQLEDGATRPAVVEHKGQGTGHTWLEMVVTEGRNRLVRRMCDAIGHPALRVVRVEMGTIKLEGLKPGQYRYLEGEEINALYRVAKMPTTPAQPEHAELTGYRVLGESRRGRGPMPGQDILPDGFVAKVSRRERAAQEQGQLRAEAKRERRQARQARHGGPKQEDRPAPTERLGRHDFQPRTEERSEHGAGRGPRSGGNEWKPRGEHRGPRSGGNEWKPRGEHRGPRSGGNEWKPREDRGPRPGGNEWKPREDRGPRSGGNEWKPRGEHRGPRSGGNEWKPRGEHRGPRSGGNEWKPRDGDRPVHRRFGQPQDDRGPGRTHGREDNRGGPRGRDRDDHRGGPWQRDRDDNRGGPRGRDRDNHRGGPWQGGRDDNRGGPRGRDRDDHRGGPWQRDRDDNRSGPRRFGRDDPRGSTRRFGRDPNRSSGADRDRDEDGRPQRSWQQRGPGAPRGRTDGNRKAGGAAPQRDGGRGQGPKGNGARFDAADTKAKGKSPRPRTDPKKSKKKKRK